MSFTLLHLAGALPLRRDLDMKAEQPGTDHYLRKRETQKPWSAPNLINSIRPDASNLTPALP
jgi:hypothetical protein